MKNITRTLSATASSVLLAAGFSRIAEKLDPMSSQLDQGSAGQLREADNCTVPTLISTFSAR